MGSHRCCRLGFDFDVGTLHAELQRAVAIGWTRHFVAQNYAGDWSGIALRSLEAAPGHAESRPGVCAAAYLNTSVLEGCGYLKQVLAQFQCPVGSARLLQLGPGSVIKEHTDLDLGYESGNVRLHVPIQTRPEVEFFVEHERVLMREGECWYVDTSLRHRVANRSAQSRVHLVFDCELNDWLREHLARAGLRPRPRDACERRGLRRADGARVIEQLRTMGGSAAQRLASELEQELLSLPPAPPQVAAPGSERRRGTRRPG
jgi:hypothetical protein